MHNIYQILINENNIFLFSGKKCLLYHWLHTHRGIIIKEIITILKKLFTYCTCCFVKQIFETKQSH